MLAHSSLFRFVVQHFLNSKIWHTGILSDPGCANELDTVAPLRFIPSCPSCQLPNSYLGYSDIDPVLGLDWSGVGTALMGKQCLARHMLSYKLCKVSSQGVS